MCATEGRQSGHVAGESLPQHVGIIMDGNGRWAQAKGMLRIAGHQAGVETARRIVSACSELRIPVLTLYTFSSENWARPQQEVTFLMRLCQDYVIRELPELMRRNVKLQVLGRRQHLPTSLLDTLGKAVVATRENTGLILNLALNYGGRAEIVDAMRRILRVHASGHLGAQDLDEAMFASYLYTAGLPDLDLIIRTAGEYRTSNFLLWQAAYALLWVTPVYWPGFQAEHLLEAVAAWRANIREEVEQ